MRLVKIGDAWVDPSVVVAVRRFGGPCSLVLIGGYELPTGPGVATDEEIAALVAATGHDGGPPTRAIHPLALAHLEAAATSTNAGRLTEQNARDPRWNERCEDAARNVGVAHSAWRNAGCPIWAEP